MTYKRKITGTEWLAEDDNYYDGQREELAAQRERLEKVQALATELRAAAIDYIDLVICPIPGALPNASDRSTNFSEVEHLLLDTLASIRFKRDKPWLDQIVREWRAAWEPIDNRIHEEILQNWKNL
jgi:hypothetical protein